MLQVMKHISSKKVHILVPLVSFMLIVSYVALKAHDPSKHSDTTLSSPASSTAVSQNPETSKPSEPAPSQPQSAAQAGPTTTGQASKPAAQQKPAATAPAPTPMTVTSLSLTGSITCQYDSDSMLVIAHAVSHVTSASFNSNHAGGTVNWKWEIQGDVSEMDGAPAGTFSRSVYAATRSMALSTFGDAPSLDMEGPSDGMRFRAVILSPNPVVSNWIETSSCN